MKWILLFSLPFILFGCASIPKNTQVSTKEIKVGPGPEDFALDTSFSYPRLLVACAERREKTPYGEVHEINLQTGQSRVLTRVGHPADFKFNPHGVDIQTLNGNTYLYAISHIDKYQHVVFKYKVEQDQLVYETVYMNKRLYVSPNDVCVSADGEVYITNDSKKRGSLMEQLFKKKGSTVIYHNPNIGSWAISADKMAYANGIATRGDKLYVSTTRSNRIFEFDKEADGKLSNRKELVKINGLDNLIFYGDYLITTSHPRVLAFVGHAKNPKKNSPSLIHKVNLKTGESEIIFADDGERISAASTGLIYKGKLYIAQVFDPYVLEVDLGSASAVSP